MFLPRNGPTTVMMARTTQASLGAPVGIDLGKLLGQLALAAHGEHNAARGAVEGVHRAHGSKRGDDEHGQVQEHVDALKTGKRGNGALNKLMPVKDSAERVNADHVEAAGGQQGQGDDLAELVPVKALGCFLSLLRNGVETGVEERGQNQDRHDTGEQAGALGGGLTAASTGDLGEHRHGVVRRAGEQRDAHGE